MGRNVGMPESAPGFATLPRDDHGSGPGPIRARRDVDRAIVAIPKCPSVATGAAGSRAWWDTDSGEREAVRGVAGAGRWLAPSRSRADGGAAGRHLVRR